MKWIFVGSSLGWVGWLGGLLLEEHVRVFLVPAKNLLNVPAKIFPLFPAKNCNFVAR